jgi:hypothetical protein
MPVESERSRISQFITALLLFPIVAEVENRTVPLVARVFVLSILTYLKVSCCAPLINSTAGEKVAAFLLFLITQAILVPVPPGLPSKMILFVPFRLITGTPDAG